MKILLDMQGAQCQSRHRGIGRYSLDLAKAFAQVAAKRHDVQFAFNAQLDEATDSIIATLQPHADVNRRLVIPALGDVAAQYAGNETRRRAGELLTRHGLTQARADVVWFSSMIEGYVDDALIPEGGVPGTHTVATLYDLIPLHEPEAYLGHPRVKAWYEGKIEALSQCDLLLSISEWVRDDALARLGLDPARIVTIGGGVEPRFRPPDDAMATLQRVQSAHGITRPYVLYNGGFDPRKNVARLIQAFASLPPGLRDTHQLVIVGRTSTEQMSGLKSAMRAAHVAPSSVIFTGFVSDEALVDLYASCALFVFPSTLEGFGLPPLEAMSCGAPVLASNTTSLPEVIGRPDATFDPTRTDAIASAMADALGQPERSDMLRQHAKQQASRFTWEAVAMRAMHAMEALAARSTRRPLVAATQPSSPLLLCVDATAQAISIESLRNHYATSTTPMPVDAMRPPADFSALLDSADRIVYVTTLEYLWQTAALTQRWPGVWLLAPPTTSATPAASPTVRYASGGYAACFESTSALSSPPVNCLGILVAAGSSIPPSIDASGIAVAEWQEGSTNMVAPQLESWFGTADAGGEAALLDELGRVGATLDDDDLARISDAVVTLRPQGATSQWLVDVTQIVQRDIGTGIQRVVRSILTQWLRSPPPGVRIEPIALVNGRFRYARRYALRLLGLDDTALDDDFVQVAAHDTYIGLDWSAEAMSSAESLLRDWHRRGVGMHFVVHDLLPITLPKAFHPFARNLFNRWLRHVSCLADGLHCVSAATAGELSSWLDQSNVPYQFAQKPLVDNFPLGSEALVDTAVSALPQSLAQANLQRATILMVGTLEPRKGHVQALDAFERLWSSGRELNFVIVGHAGWMVEALVRRIEQHEELDRRLFWFQNADDQLLESIYRSSTALLAPSFGEGYGLPLVEAGHRGLPVIARDLPVFRETMGDYASYFRAADSAELALALDTWLREPHTPCLPRSWPTWRQSATALAAAILKGSGHDGVQTIV